MVYTIILVHKNVHAVDKAIGIRRLTLLCTVKWDVIKCHVGADMLWLASVSTEDAHKVMYCYGVWYLYGLWLHVHDHQNYINEFILCCVVIKVLPTMAYWQSSHYTYCTSAWAQNGDWKLVEQAAKLLIKNRNRLCIF